METVELPVIIDSTLPAIWDAAEKIENELHQMGLGIQARRVRSMMKAIEHMSEELRNDRNIERIVG